MTQNYMSKQATAPRGENKGDDVAVLRADEDPQQRSHFESNGRGGCLEAGVQSVHQPNLIVLDEINALLELGKQT
jgi:hypothetical protein